jgi:hypothetical protein
MNKAFFILVLLLIGIGAFFAFKSNIYNQKTEDNTTVLAPSNKTEIPSDVLMHIGEKSNFIVVSAPEPLSTISSPLTLRGEARGYWFFEATFPVVLVDWDGKIIAEGYVTADDEWMTEDFVTFKGTLEFEDPSWEEDFSKRGSLIFQKNNPSGLPENDDALEIPVRF